MNFKSTAAFGACLLLLFNACERPDAPDFSLEHRVQVPITTEKTYQFLGGSEALIDTTSEDFDSLFTVAGDGLVSLSKSEKFDFGNLDDTIPEVEVDPTGVNSAVGELQMGSFASGDSVGSASFNDITGYNSGNYPAGTTIPAGSGSTNITLDTDNFISAQVKSGGIRVAFENRLGFEADNITITLNAGPNVVGSDSFTGVGHGDTRSTSIPISSGTTLSDLNADIQVDWVEKEMSDNPEELVVRNVSGDNLIASEVEAAIPAQDFNSTGTSLVDDANFEFTDPTHYIELGAGQLLINDVVNGIDLEIETLQVSFPNIRTAPYTPGDSLVVRFEGSTAIPANSNDAVQQNFSLADVRVYAENNVVDYNISGVTENTQEAGSIRTIHENDSFTANVEFANLEIREAYGIIVPRNVLINNDIDSNGIIDLFNDNEAEVISIDGLKSLSEQLEGLEFADPRLGILYNTNLGAETMIYAAIAGENANGEVVYLTGKSGEENYVSSSEAPAELRANGQPLSSENLIKFTLDQSTDGSTITGESLFDKETTNADAFMNNLPAEVRFIGLAGLNENSEIGTVTDPVRFDPSMNINLPLHFLSSTSTFSDTTETDLKDLPGSDDEQSLSEATVTIGYINNLPFRLELYLIMLDEQYNQVTQIPLPNQEASVIRGAPVNSSTNFVESSREGKLVISLNEEQLGVLNKTRHMQIQISFNTTDQQEVKVRAEDSISLSIKMSVAVKSNFN